MDCKTIYIIKYIKNIERLKIENKASEGDFSRQREYM